MASPRTRERDARVRHAQIRPQHHKQHPRERGVRALDARHGVEPRAVRGGRRQRRGQRDRAVRVPPRAVFHARRAAVVACLLHEALHKGGKVLGRVDDNVAGGGAPAADGVADQALATAVDEGVQCKVHVRKAAIE